MSDHVDVLIVGAGLSGIGAAHHIQASFPGKSYAILETRDVSYANVVTLRHGKIDDGTMRFARRAQAREPASAQTASPLG
jgi:cation diffusion facilitator CzcD-associated flavoprotein CzcO